MVPGVREGLHGQPSGARKEHPAAGEYDVAFFLDSQRIVQCFRAAAESNPEIRTGRTGLALEYLVEDRDVPAGDNVSLRFRLADSVTGSGKAGLNDVTM